MSSRILVVDDDEKIREILRIYLEREGYEVEEAADGEGAILAAERAKPDLVILDLMLPQLDGWEVCRRLRTKSQVPIIMLTARGEEFDRVLGLELGADDYVSKPFSPRELVARVRAVLRRTEKGPSQVEALRFPGLEIDRSSRRVFCHDEEVALTPKEFELLWFLASNPERVFTREQLLDRVWGYEYLGDTRTVDTHIKRLREKLSPKREFEAVCEHGRRRDHGNLEENIDSREHEPEEGSAGDIDDKWLIKTVWGLGYRFEPPSQ